MRSNQTFEFVGPLDIACTEFFNHDMLRTWLSDWQVENNRVSPLQSRAISSSAKNLLTQVEDIEKDMSVKLPEYFPALTCEEWLGTFIAPTKRRLTEILTKANQNLSLSSC